MRRQADAPSRKRVCVLPTQTMPVSNTPLLPRCAAPLTVWHRPVQVTLTRTSPFLGGPTSTVSSESGLPASQATAALQVMGFPAVDIVWACVWMGRKERRLGAGANGVRHPRLHFSRTRFQAGPDMRASGPRQCRRDHWPCPLDHSSPCHWAMLPAPPSSARGG